MSNISAERREVVAFGEYTYGDRETREDAKNVALEDAKRNALEQVIVYVKTKSTAQDYSVGGGVLKPLFRNWPNK